MKDELPAPHGPANDAEVDLAALHEESGREPPQMWLLGVIMAAMFFSGMFLIANSGGFQADVYDANRVAWAGGGPAGDTAQDPKVLGKRVYSQNCAVCHQQTGQGVPGSFPPLAGSEWVLGQEWHGDNHMVKIVIHGLQGPVTVKGQTYNNTMAPWGSVLKDEQIAAVLTYIRSEWGNDAPPIGQEFVAKVREQTKDRTTPWTMQELQAIPKESSEQAPAAGGEAPATPEASPGGSPPTPPAEGGNP